MNKNTYESKMQKIRDHSEIIDKIRSDISDILKSDGVEISDMAEHELDMLVEDIVLDYL